MNSTYPLKMKTFGNDLEEKLQFYQISKGNSATDIDIDLRTL